MRRAIPVVVLVALAAAAVAGVLGTFDGGGGSGAGVAARLLGDRRPALAAPGRRLPARPANPAAPARPAATAHPAATAAPAIATRAPSSGSSCVVNRPPPEPPHPIDHPEWIGGVTITEYYPAPERWFSGRLVAAPGLAGRHRVDWLYSARGLAMEGDGVDLAGRPVRIDQLGSTGWVNAAGAHTVPVCLGKWSAGFPVWLIGGWRNSAGAVTFPLVGGGWSNGPGGRELPYGGVTFAEGQALPVRPYHSIAVDPKLIPEGSRVFIPAYRAVNGGWFVAEDTGGAIRGHHIDVYRPPPATANELGRYLTGQRVLVVPPR